MNIRITFSALLLFFSLAAWAYDSTQEQQIITITPQIALPIGIKIWFNECGGSVEGLTTWNKGEVFASLGIGHFLWHPYPSKSASLSRDFPALVNYIKERGIQPPEWLQGDGLLYCPWANRTEFYRAKNSLRMIELRNFLQRSIAIQAEYMTKNLQNFLPKLLSYTPKYDRQFIYDKFYSLAKTPSGLYALVDFINFKGAGLSTAPGNYEHGTGLLQVLKGMRDAPPDHTSLRAYVWSAKKALTKRVLRSSPEKRYEIWLAGWFKRLETYLEGDLVNMQVVP